MTGSLRALVAGLVTVLVAALALGACSGGDSEREAAPGGTLVPEATRVTTTTTTTTTIPRPTTTTAPPPAPTGLPAGGVLGFGDSVMVDVRPQLEAHGIAVDASVNRQFFNAARDLSFMALAGRLPPTVIVALGTNGPFNAQQFDGVMQALAKQTQVAFVNVCQPQRWQDQVNTALAEGVARFEHKAVLIDWHAASCGHPEYFAADRVHANSAGAAVYADIVMRAIGV